MYGEVSLMKSYEFSPTIAQNGICSTRLRSHSSSPRSSHTWTHSALCVRITTTNASPKPTAMMIAMTPKSTTS